MTIDLAHPADAAGVLALLEENALPTEGLVEHLDATLVAREGQRVVGSAALEVYPDGALLRSVAVASSHRGRGLGRALANAALGLARTRNVTSVFLLTTTAEEFFPKLGFVRIDRADVPAGVRASVEFTSVCPASAVVMRRTAPGRL